MRRFRSGVDGCPAPGAVSSGRGTYTGSRHCGQGTNLPANFAFTAIAMPQPPQ